MSKMFEVNGKRMPTYNPLGGECKHQCDGRWSQGDKGLVKKYNIKKYQGNPCLIEKELKRKFNPAKLKGMTVFVCDMLDLMADNVPSEMIIAVLNVIRDNPCVEFLILTKNPGRYEEFINDFPPNLTLGATIQSNIDYPETSKAPVNSLRFEAMKNLNWPKKFVSIEPIMKFDLIEFVAWIIAIAPKMVFVGYDNYDTHFIEPSLYETQQLIEHLEHHTEVIPKTLRPAWNE